MFKLLEARSSLYRGSFLHLELVLVNFKILTTYYTCIYIFFAACFEIYNFCTPCTARSSNCYYIMNNSSIFRNISRIFRTFLQHFCQIRLQHFCQIRFVSFRTDFGENVSESRRIRRNFIENIKICCKINC